MIRSLIWVVLLLSPSAFADEVVAVVDLKFLKDTGEPASTLCFEDDGQNDSCATWSTFYLFEARVKKVVHGEPVSRKFQVWFGRHALKKGNIRNAVAKLKPLPAGHEASYQVVALGDREEFYCFGTNKHQQHNVSIEPQGTGMQCYESE